MKHLSSLYSRKLVMNLQRFGDDPEGDDPSGEGAGAGEGDQQGEKLFSRVEMGKIIAAEVKKATESLEAKKAEEIQQAITEAEELAKLSKDKREQALLEKERNAFAKERDAFNQERLDLEKQKQLVAEGLPSTFANRVVGSNAEEILADIQALKTEFDAAVQEGIKVALKRDIDEPLGTPGGQTKSSEGVSFAEARNKQEKAPANSLWD